MRRLCPLCGAKLYAEEAVCRQCATPVGVTHEMLAAADDELSPDADAAPADVAPAPPIASAHEPIAGDWHDGEHATPDESAGFAALEDPATAYASPARTPTDPGLDGGIVTDSDGVTPPSFDAPTLAVDDEPEPPRRGLAIGVALAAVATVAAVTTWWMWPARSDAALEPEAEAAEAEVEAPSEPDAAEPDRPASAAGCQELEALAGQWELTTEVVTSTHPAQIGIHGFFSMSVEIEGCTATAELVKAGYTGRWYDDDHVQRGKATLQPGPHFGFVGAFDLRDGNGRGGKQDLVLTVHEHRLAGTYRMPGRTGFLEGARDPGRRILPVLGQQPCIARCAVACDLLRRDADDGAGREALDQCNTTCSAGSEPKCGDARPLPEQYLVAVHGPADTLSAACKLGGREGCRTEVKIGKKPTQSYESKNGEGVWRAGLLTIAGGAVQLGLRTRAGWFASGPILVLDGAELTRARLVVRELGSDRDERYIVGELETPARVATFACRVENDAPVCAALPARASAVSPLPARAVAVAGKPGSVEPGVYSW